jgi:hypothetical protein
MVALGKKDGRGAGCNAFFIFPNWLATTNPLLAGRIGFNQRRGHSAEES